MKVNIVSTKLIKPCSPTPQSLRNHKISFMDNLNPPMNVGVILLYDNSISPKYPKQTTTHFQESLSKILPQFYPLAGRYIKKDHSVDCDDSGAEFVEAQVADDVTLSDVILASERDLKLLNDYFLPPKFHQVDESPTDPLLSIRITRFKCGGLVVSVSVSHRIFDASSVGTFLAVWSNANKNPGMVGSIKIRPSFDTPPEFFSGSYISRGDPIKTCWDPNIVVKRFSFHKEAITRLRSKLRLPENSRVRVVSAVIAEAMIGVDRAKHSGKSRACLIAQAVNMRGRTFPPLPKHSCQNWVILSPTRCMIPNTVVGNNNNNNIQELVDILGDGLEKTVYDCAEIFSPTGRDVKSIIMEPLVNVRGKSMGGEVNVFAFSDWSKFGFYEADFGWGKPVGAGIGAFSRPNIIVLMDSKENGGLEAWVHLNRSDMPYFEKNDQIKLYAT
ncbi:hypothetical protein ABFS82_08G091800 [Erythranthe guttata]|uniref:Uncharacterized protein n=1 Tax=Erythranthe guttata TaxID=4155 RepID=A0A022Q821_ERYGU|nr:PREDICTED: pelargonidin 3-O-(6-caffeoylglucoside) 5-O-(6-O-malonylglucoside) 4'''-malonyltransferase-like [Erythranthe guttata]EYU23754.1 hypothetical protein MIMGU_mgv1a006483mg [Erythranthe guttata]|eukprot:XP_012853678.1 PREDICTED: pelargonidin 3-O-(6-caffeoylglucoside) 5-O-(6-O-malonylglucoside) 4'''-malonyltransferase-like [Erythranthe guttata]